MTERNEAYKKDPSHRVDINPWPFRVRACIGKLVLADSHNALLVEETAHKPVYYFPSDDVSMESLEKTAHGTFCPYKGHASYWSLRLGEEQEENLVWAYEQPFPEVAELHGHVAFYENRVDIESFR